MRPLLFLGFRTFINGVKRAFSSPRRVLGTLFFFGYYLWMFRPFWRSDDSGITSGLNRLPTQRLEFPPLYLIEAVVFALFCLLTVMLAFGLFSPRGGFRSSDVDVLFPTPISPKVVMLFRLLRDYFFTLILPLILALFLYRPVAAGWSSLFRNVPHPESAGNVFRMLAVGWILVSLAGISIGYAGALYLDRPEERYDRARKWGLYLFIGTVVGVILLVSWRVVSVGSGTELVVLAQSWWLRAIFFLASAATQVAIAPLSGDWWAAAGGGAVLLGSIGVALIVALRQSPWLYEQAAAQATVTESVRQMQSRGDMYGVLTAQARTGKIKSGARNRIHQLRFVGPMALVWKEMLVMQRTARFQQVMFLFLAIGLGAMIALIPKMGQGNMRGAMLIITQISLAMGSTFAVVQVGFIELLRRVDLIKSLPFSPTKILFTEVMSKSLLVILCCVPGSIAALIADPQLWSFAVGSMILVPGAILFFGAMSLLSTVLFPDIDDPTQRGFRGLVTMLIIVIAAGPSITVFTVALMFGTPAYLAAIPATLLNIGIAVLACSVAGQLYASYNPSE